MAAIQTLPGIDGPNGVRLVQRMPPDTDGPNGVRLVQLALEIPVDWSEQRKLLRFHAR